MIFKGGGSVDIKKLKLQAQKAIGQGKYDEALQILHEIARTTPDPEVSNTIGDLYVRKQDYEKALKFFEDAYRVYKEQDFKDVAISVAKKILRIDKHRIDVYFDLMQMELEAGNIDKALDWAQELIELPDLDSSHLSKLFSLINELASTVQENTEQATKFERLFLKVQELAESLALMSMEKGIEFAQPNEFFDSGDMGYVGNFLGFGSEEVSERKKKEKEKLEEPVEKIEFLESEEGVELEEPLGIETSSGLSGFLGVETGKKEEGQKSEKIVFDEAASITSEKKPSIEEELRRILEEESSKEKAVQNISEELVEEKPENIIEEREEEKFISPTSKSEEEFKTVVEELPPTFEEEFQVKQDRSKFEEGGLGEEFKTVVEEVSEEFEERAEEKLFKEEPKKFFEEEKVELTERKLIEEEENPEILKREFEEIITKTEQKKDFKPTKKEEAKPSIPETVTPTKESVPTQQKAVTVGQVPQAGAKPKIEGAPKKSEIPSRENEQLQILLKVIRDIRDDIASLEEWPYEQNLSFDVAKEYYEMKLYNCAVEEFQKLLSDPRYRLQAMIYLGKIFYEMGDLDFSEIILKKAIEEIGPLEKDYLEAYYYLALTFEEMKRFQEARDLYYRVYVLDSTYKDVSQKVKTFRSMKI